MCGIAGFFGTGDTDTLEKMNVALARRGPDDRGIFMEGSVGLAQTRLSIIDLSSSGHQPMKSTTGQTVIVFNGEIYNFRELREELASKKSYRFQGGSDTEVILALYEAYGVEAFSKLNGMFAIALYDLKTKELMLVRDRMGKKPLYWGVSKDTLLFGSELKALMCHKDFSKEIDSNAVRLYLTYEAVPTPFSIFKGIKKLQAGHYLVYSQGKKPREVCFWDRPNAVLDISFEEATSRLDELLQASVARRLVSDVPLGVFLSGGLDSSTIAYYASRGSGEQLKTFSIGFSNKDFDESKYAEEVARTLNVAHTTEYFSPEKCIELLPEVFSYLDEPIADASIMPTYLLSAFARKHVTVALAGDGSDELFAGYPTFQAESLVGAYRTIPEWMRQGLIEPAIRALPVSHSYFSLDFKLKRFIDGAGTDPRHRHQRWLGAFTDTEANELLQGGGDYAFASPYELLNQYFHCEEKGDVFHNDVLWSYARTYLMDEVLVKVDRASMANSLEVRAPFLDYTLVEFVQNLPYKYKYHAGTGKYILKHLMKDRLPRGIVFRKKRGFAMPIGQWLTHELKPLMHDLLSKEAIGQSGFFDYTVIKRIMSEHERGVADHRKKLWTLMVFQMWFKRWSVA